MNKTKSQYESKTAAADEAEDDARIVGSPQTPPRPLISTKNLKNLEELNEKSPQAIMAPSSDPNTPTVANPGISIADSGIAEGDREQPFHGMGLAGFVKDLRERGDREKSSEAGLGRKASVMDRIKALTAPLASEQKETDDAMLKARREEKGKAKELGATVEPPKMIEIAGINNGAKEWSFFFANARNELPKRR